MHDNNLTDAAVSILELIEQVKLVSFKIYYQPTFRAEADDPREAAQKLVSYVVNVHAQNADVSGKACPIADGVVDYGRIIEALVSYEYDGDIEVEFVRGDDKLTALQRDRDYLASWIGSLDDSPLRNVFADLV